MGNRDHVPSPAELTLPRLLGPVDADVFFSEYWGRKPLLVQRQSPEFYRNVFSLADVDTLLFAGRFRPGEFRIARADEGIDLQFRSVEDPDAVPPVTTFYRAFDQGYSIVLHGLHLRWPAMATVARHLQGASAGGVTSNVYLTPAGTQAYPLHYDTHDFFIFQLHGAKHWRIFEPKRPTKPIRELDSLSDEPWQAGPLLQEFDLEDGDLLYVPRGFGHEVVSRDSTSLHLTVGLHGMTWHRLLTNSLANAATESEELRTFVPVKFSRSGEGILDAGGSPDVLGIARGGLDPQAGIDLWEKQYVKAHDPIPDGHWVALDRAGRIDGSTVAARRFGIPHRLETRGDKVVLHFLQEKVERAAADRPALEYVATADRFAVDSIPGLPLKDRCELARQLVRKGFLTIVDPGPSRHPAIPSIPVESQDYPVQGVSSMNRQTEAGESRVTPMNEPPSEVKNDSAQQPTSTGGCGCSSKNVTSDHVYAIGRVSARFPSVDIEKELYQVMRGAETAKLTDGQVLYQVLSQPDNSYIAREMCWVFTVRGVETFTIIPRTGLELVDLVNALNLTPSAGATNVIIGTRSPIGLPASSCGGLSLPTVIASKIYSFNVDEFVKELPLGEAQIAAGKELLERITHLIDNVGDMDEHRAVNYLALRYLAVYNLVVENFNRDFSLQGVQVRPVVTRSNRKIVDVYLKFISRKTDVREVYGVRVDVTGMYPFLVSPLHPVFEKD
jgi:hypothetical protein